MKEQVLQAVSHWFEQATPARKAADIFAAAVITLLAGLSYSAFQAEGEIRRLAIKALDRTPELDASRATKLAPTLLADVQKAGGAAVAVWKVDLASNTTQLVVYAGPDSLRDKFPRLRNGLEKVPFIAAGMPAAQLALASSMLTGVIEVAYYELADVTLVACPVPDKSGSMLAGFVMAAIPNRHGEDDPIVNNLKVILSEFSRNVL